MIRQTTQSNLAINPVKARRIAAIVLALLGLGALTVVGIFIGKPLIAMLGDPEAFQAWVTTRGAWGQLSFVGLMALQVIVAWLPGEPLELGAGYAFGFWQGTVLCMAGLVLGSVFVFLMVRHFGRRIVLLFFPAEKIESIPLLRDERRLSVLAFITFMIPGTPKDLLTYCVGLTPMKLRTWLLVSGVARIPPVITSTLSGSALGEQQYALAIIVFAATMLLSGAGLLYYRRLVKRSREVAV